VAIPDRKKKKPEEDTGEKIVKVDSEKPLAEN
jgi:hypothetical protein